MKRLEIATTRALDPEFRRLLDNYGIEAPREATDERFRMLTYAAAISFSVPMTIAELSRAERTIRELDPKDVDALRNLMQSDRDGNLRFATEDVDVLLAAGCVSAKWGAGSIVRYSVTTSGDRVLRLLRSYEPKL
jgi:hypothetical protein